MKKLTFALSMVCFSIPAFAQFVDVAYDHRMAKTELMPVESKIENVEVTPILGQPAGADNKVIFTFTYLNNELQDVTANSTSMNIKCGDPEKFAEGSYITWWCYADNYNIFWGCDEEDKNYVSVKAPR